jgi:hypothetical protein
MIHTCQTVESENYSQILNYNSADLLTQAVLTGDIKLPCIKIVHASLEPTPTPAVRIEKVKQMKMKLHSVMSFVSALNCTQERDQVLKVVIATSNNKKRRNEKGISSEYPRTQSVEISRLDKQEALLFLSDDGRRA